MAIPRNVKVGVWNSDLEKIIQSRINLILSKTAINECDKGEFRQIMMLACYDLVVSGKWDGSTISYLHQTAYWTMRKEMTRLGERPLPVDDVGTFEIKKNKPRSPLNLHYAEPFEDEEEFSDEMAEILTYLDNKLQGTATRAVLREIMAGDLKQIEIAQRVGISRARVHQIVHRIRKLAQKDPVLVELAKKLSKKN